MTSPDGGVIVVTGSSGLIGSAIVTRFLSRFDVAALDRPGGAAPPEGANAIDVDLTSESSLRTALDEVRSRHGRRIDSVIHLASHYDFSGAPSPLYESLTVRGTERLIDALQDFDVEQFVFASSMLVHKPCDVDEKINESWPLEPKWEYPRSKVRAETVLKAKHERIPLVILRIAGVYDDQCQSIPIAQQIKRTYERQFTSRIFPGNPAHGQSFLHLDDLVNAVEAAVDRRPKLGKELTLLVGEPEVVSYGQIQDSLCRLLHHDSCPIHHIPRSLAKAGARIQNLLPGGEKFIKPWMIDLADDHYDLDISAAKAILGWWPRRRLADTIPLMIKALLKDPARWYRENHLNAPAHVDARQPAAAGH